MPINGGETRRGLADNPWFVLLLSVAGAFIVYWPCLGNLWYNDDVVFLVEADALRAHPESIFKNLVMGFYRPIFTGYVAILKIFFGAQPLGYYICGILIHSLNVFAVWALARRVVGGVAGPLAAAAAFLTFFSHSEATLWMSSHNSSMLAGFSIAAILLNWRAMESPQWTDRFFYGVCTALVVGLNVFTKETGLTVIGWIGIAELLYYNWRTCMSARGARDYLASAIVRYAMIGAVVFVYIMMNPVLAKGIASQADAAALDVRVSFRNITVQKALWAYGWLFSPWIHTHRAADLGMSTEYIAGGIAALAAPLIVIIAFARRAWRAVLLGTVLALSGLAGPCLFKNLSTNSSRFYYYSTVGAALVIGALAGRATFDNLRFPKWAKAAVAAALIAYFGYETYQIKRLNDHFYDPMSHDQVRFIRDLAPYMTKPGKDHIYIIEPEIPNMIHIQNALFLFYDIDPELVTIKHDIPAGEFEQWAQGLRQRNAHAPDQGRMFTIISWNRETGVFEPAKRVPTRPTLMEYAYGTEGDWRPASQVSYAVIKPRTN
ncbi:MAG: hypothetical protein HY286_15735 [Planctomycetes bacterium]|nr:hypothetical protein [Planctomycetota bacterium]